MDVSLSKLPELVKDRVKELGGKTGVLVGPDLPSAGWELKQGSDPHIRAIGWVRGETLKAESEAADLW